MSMTGEMTFFLGIEVNQSPRGIFINQSNYVLEILKKYGMETCDPVGTPIEIKDKLDLDKNGTLVDATKYQSMIGALMYLTSSRPNIVHATCLCARYQAKPTKKHLKEVKRIFCYLRGTVNMGLWYTKGSDFELTGFSNADYAGCKDTFKSTSDGTQFLDYQLAGLFTKALPVDRFNYLVRLLGMRSLSPQELERLEISHPLPSFEFVRSYEARRSVDTSRDNHLTRFDSESSVYFSPILIDLVLVSLAPLEATSGSVKGEKSLIKELSDILSLDT
ncbi:hypothetical protein Tco_0530131 [Tanacetum coccineum]